MSHKTARCNPYLAFDGNCREAMTLYTETLKGKLELMTFAEAPFETPAEYKDKIMHCVLIFGDSALIMASDNWPGYDFAVGNNNHLVLSYTDVNEAARIFNALSEGGTVTMPFEDVFWGAKFGAFTDKYGVNWKVNCEESDLLATNLRYCTDVLNFSSDKNDT